MATNELIDFPYVIVDPDVQKAEQAAFQVHLVKIMQELGNNFDTYNRAYPNFIHNLEAGFLRDSTIALGKTPRYPPDGKSPTWQAYIDAYMQLRVRWYNDFIAARGENLRADEQVELNKKLLETGVEYLKLVMYRDINAIADQFPPDEAPPPSAGEQQLKQYFINIVTTFVLKRDFEEEINYYKNSFIAFFVNLASAAKDTIDESPIGDVVDVIENVTEGLVGLSELFKSAPVLIVGGVLLFGLIALKK